MNDKWEIYKDAGQEWRWRRTSPNGNIVGASTEGYANRAHCEENASRNGWNSSELSEENKEIKRKAYELYKEQGFKDGNDFIVWLEAEKRAGIKSRAQRHRQMNMVLSAIVAMLCVIVVILLMILFKKTPPVELTKQIVSEPKIMMYVLDTQVDEKLVVLSDTHFDFDKSTLSQKAKALLDNDVQSLKDNPTMKVRMAGYTSAEGTEQVNQKLSERRANSVRDYLIEKGVAPGRITVIGYGRTRPALYEVKPGDIDTKEAKANMRVLFQVVVK